jgi:hypothetical protein
VGSRPNVKAGKKWQVDTSRVCGAPTRNGDIPWNYVGFLDYAADRIFLRKVDGGYIFIHRMLMEYFAALETEPSGHGNE